MTPLRFALFGAGFWARYQLAAWKEIKGAQCVAICDPHPDKAETLARDHGIPAWYFSPEALLANESVDFVDIVSPAETHAALVRLAAQKRLPALCQKPMAPAWEEAQAMVQDCAQSGTSLYVHENWRWQIPLRQVSRLLREGTIGRPFRARLSMVSGFPVFANQPFLRMVERFILMDMGTHLLDVARFLFGEAQSVTCQTQRVHSDIAGEDVATVLLAMHELTVVCEMGYAENYLERDTFPQTMLFVEGAKGSLELAPGYWIRVTTKEGTHARCYPPPRYTWADPAYDVVQSSMVPCLSNLVGGLRGEHEAETTAADNLKTLRLVFAAYESAATNRVIAIPD